MFESVFELGAEQKTNPGPYGLDFTKDFNKDFNYIDLSTIFC